ncbi:hypothetical protein ACLUEY_03785 [Vreelandella aquamarina]
MKTVTKVLLAILSTATLSACSTLDDKKTPGVNGLSEQDQYALEVGRKVLGIQAALDNPDQPASMEAVKALGLDSRHYVMVRGWLVQELRSAESWQETSTYQTSPTYKNTTDQRINALRRMIRAIDLE